MSALHSRLYKRNNKPFNDTTDEDEEDNDDGHHKRQRNGEYSPDFNRHSAIQENDDLTISNTVISNTNRTYRSNNLTEHSRRA